MNDADLPAFDPTNYSQDVDPSLLAKVRPLQRETVARILDSHSERA